MSLKRIGQAVYDWDIRLIVNDEQLRTIEQVKQFLEGSEALESRGLCVEEECRFLSSTPISTPPTKKEERTKKERIITPITITEADFSVKMD